MTRHRSGAIQPIVLAGLLVAGVVVGLGAGYFSYRALHNTVATNTTNTTTNTVVQNDNVVIVNTPETVANANVAANTNTTAATSTGRKTNGTITWIAPVKIGSLKIFKSTGGQYPIDYEIGGNGGNNVNGVNTTAAAYYHVGNVASGKYSGGQVVMVQAWGDGIAIRPNVYYVIHSGAKIYLLQKESYGTYGTGDGLNHAKLTADSSTVLDDLHYPKTLAGPGADQKITITDYTDNSLFFDDAKLQYVFTDPVYGSVYTTKGYNYTTSSIYGGGDSTFIAYGYYLKAPDSTARVYVYTPSIVSAQNVPAVTWTDNKNNTTQYSYTDVGGCGSRNYASVIDPSKVTPADLKVVGTASNGDEVFGLVDSNNALLKSQYNDTYVVYEGSKVSYATFLTNHPLFFWTDSFGRLIKFQKATYQSQAECGKPVIYLYPNTTTNVHIDLKPQGGFSYSEPAYNSGWNVTATPSGKLTNLADGKTYPYLFWEGRGGLYSSPTVGSVVQQKDVHGFLASSLAKLGLNIQESSDFIEFWEPRMQGSPYYRVSFYGNQMMDQLAPLIVTPKPDTVIRVLMDYAPLIAPQHIAPQRLFAPARNGFTIVEWGGVLR